MQHHFVGDTETDSSERSAIDGFPIGGVAFLWLRVLARDIFPEPLHVKNIRDLDAPSDVVLRSTQGRNAIGGNGWDEGGGVGV